MVLHKLFDHHQRQVNRKAFGDLRQFSAALKATGQLKCVPQVVSPRLQITELCHRSLLGSGPALLFENPQGHDMPVLGNLFGTQKRVLAALELETREDLQELGRDLTILKNPKLPDKLSSSMEAMVGFARLAHVPVVRKDAAPWQNHVIEGPDVDLETLPVSTCWPEDAGRLITWGLVVTRGPNKPRINLAIYRQQLIGRNQLIMRWLPHRGGAQDFREFQQANPGRPFPLAV
ncbi:MAG TPA: UbiD family decarboxylase domain-containing protein, partial [Xanthomonadales bacterium]|nr:UbiD family decarboxylase domain-containing protein [Xanthomonadales bacterium]